MFKVVRTDGKTDWALLRKIFYVALIVWVFSVRVAHIDPFGLAQLYVVAWVMDVLSLVALWLFVWHVMWPNRPAVGASTT